VLLTLLSAATVGWSMSAPQEMGLRDTGLVPGASSMHSKLDVTDTAPRRWLGCVTS